MTIRDINEIIKAVCSNSEDYEKPCISPKYLRQKLEQLALEQEQRMLESTTKNTVDCVSRQFMFELGATCIATRNENGDLIALGAIEQLPSVTPQEPRCKECKYWKDSDGVYRRGCSAESKCPINRREVFEGNGSKKRLERLNKITHKYIKVETVRILEKNKTDGAWATLIDAPVLFESEFDKLCDCTVCVTAPTELKLARITKRDGITLEKAEARLHSQMSDEKLRQLCDFEIVNNDSGDLEIRMEAFAGVLKDKFEI